MARMVGSSVANMRRGNEHFGRLRALTMWICSVGISDQRDGASGTALRASRRSARCLRSLQCWLEFC